METPQTLPVWTPRWRNTQWELAIEKSFAISLLKIYGWRNTQWELAIEIKNVVFGNRIFVGEIPSGNWRFFVPAIYHVEKRLLEKYPVGIGDQYLSIMSAISSAKLEKYPVGIGDVSWRRHRLHELSCWRNTQWELAIKFPLHCSIKLFKSWRNTQWELAIWRIPDSVVLKTLCWRNTQWELARGSG